MQKIIAKKRYNTDTSLLVAVHSHSVPSDPAYYTEKLYRKRNGEFFLHGEGGAMSKYAKMVSPTTWQVGEQIIPLSVEVAKKWAKEHMSSKKYDEFFGKDVQENGDRESWSLKVSPATIERVRRIAGAKNLKLSEVVEKAIMLYFKEIS